LAKEKPWVDPDEAPPLTREWFERANRHDGGTLIRKGAGFDPPTGSSQPASPSQRRGPVRAVQKPRRKDAGQNSLSETAGRRMACLR